MDIDRIIAETFVARAEHHATLGSTNDLSAELAAEKGSGAFFAKHPSGRSGKRLLTPFRLPLLIVADEQTAGRGRGSNRWWTGPGSLAMSLVLEAADTEPGRQRQSPLLGLAVGVAVVEAVRPLLPDQPLGLHWPNDVMLGEKKLAGVLVEVLPGGRAVIGIGLNVNNTAGNAPEEFRHGVATLRDATGREHDRTDVLIAVLRALEAACRTLTESPEQLAAEADRLCLQRGQVLRLQLGQETVEGRCLGIAEDGLMVETSAGRRFFHTGTLAE